jgi:putative ABC transport system permease protein
MVAMPLALALAIPLAWLQLKREKMRLLVALAGIGFAVMLMFIQMGFRDALFDSAVRLHQNLNGDIYLVSPQSTALIAMKTFSQRRLQQARAHPDVETITPLYLDFALWKNPETRMTRSILVIGFDPKEPVFDDPQITSQLDKVKMPDVVLFDQDSRPEFGPVKQKMLAGEAIATEVSGRKVEVGGLFRLGASFGADGNILTSDINFTRIFNRPNSGLISVGVIHLKPGAALDPALQALRRDLEEKYQDVRVYSKEQFIQFEKGYWQSSTSIGFIFGLGAAIGFVVGTVIVYQILYTDVADHLAEYATLKAMGYKNFYLLRVVFQEALILAVMGFIPGFLLSVGLYNMTAGATSLPLAMTQARAIQVLILAVVMCTISGTIAVRKVQDADPADIF